ncbi:MAG TPA: tetratricopeptide repeat protein [Ktedonobacteraceae bacterium]|nr:tetratricopeptide repeat protein [Ktedonobacteraceae bacterium]
MAAKKQAPAQLSQEDEARIQQILGRRQTLAEELHACTSRPQAEALLADVFSAGEVVQLGLLKSLVQAGDTDAADVLLAMHELAPEKAVRKEARRALIQLAGARVVPSWTPEAEQAAVGTPVVENAPRFWKGLVSEMRDSGELQVILAWEYGLEYGEVRIISFLADFWSEGVKDFYTDTGTKRWAEDRLRSAQLAAGKEADPADGPPPRFVECTLAEGRRLLNEALEVNRWRKVEPHKEFRQYLPLIQSLILHAQDAGEDRGLTFMRRGEEPDMIAANFAGAWSMGDYGLCYDLMTPTNPVLEGRSRDEWIEMRRKWADEAHPARFEVYFLREREKAQQSALWVPTSVLSARAISGKEIELSWSLALAETPLSGTLPEMPMGTTVYKETGRHWFWTSYNLEQEKGEWRIARIKDEGVAVQGLGQEELRQRIQEHEEAMQKIMREHQPNDPGSEQFYDELVWRMWKMLALYDALLVQNPLDKNLYEEGYGRAMSVRAVERAAVYAEELVRRFPSDPDALIARQRLAAVKVALAERFSSMGLIEQARPFMEEGEELLRGSLSEQEPLGYMLLAELLMNQGKFDEGEKQLLTARELIQEPEQKAEVEFNLANLAINRERYPEAQGYLERLASLAPNYPSIWYALGFVHRKQEHHAEAEQYFRRAIEADPTDVRAYGDLAALFLEQEEFNQARDILAQGIRALPQSAHLRALMAMVYIEKKDRRRAQEYLSEAERLDPELEILPAIREVMKKL